VTCPSFAVLQLAESCPLSPSAYSSFPIGERTSTAHAALRALSHLSRLSISGSPRSCICRASVWSNIFRWWLARRAMERLMTDPWSVLLAATPVVHDRTQRASRRGRGASSLVASGLRRPAGLVLSECRAACCLRAAVDNLASSGDRHSDPAHVCHRASG
jgi:hypothetical protein